MPKFAKGSLEAKVYMKALRDKKTSAGKGIFKDISKIIKKTVKKTKNIADNVKKYTNVVIQGRNDYQPKVRTILRELGSKIIKSAVVMRSPVPSILTQALNVVSLGAFKKKLENSSYDTLFHLSLVLELEDGNKLLIEKNEVINMEKNPKTRPKTEILDVPNIPENLTVDEMLMKSKERMGQDYFTYSAKSNNCQNYIMAILQANNMGDEETFLFVKQETKQLFEGLTNLRKISNTVTDIGAKVNEITEGAGLYVSSKGSGLYVSSAKGRGFNSGVIETENGVLYPTHTVIHYYDNPMHGGNLLKKIRKSLDPNRNGLTKVFTPKLGTDIASTLIKKALPEVIKNVVSTGTTALTGNPILGTLAGETAGNAAGQKVSDVVSTKTGLGIKKKSKKMC